MSECPMCGAEVTLEADAVEGELLECADCGTDNSRLTGEVS